MSATLGRRPVSCVECQRRKQKCSRVWPCGHCKGRKVPHLCHFPAPGMPEFATGNGEQHVRRWVRKRKRTRTASNAGVEPRSGVDEGGADDNDGDHNGNGEDDDLISDGSDGGGVEVMGYSSSHPVSNLSSAAWTTRSSIQSGTGWSRTVEMDKALRILPPKPYVGLLVNLFLKGANYHYYILDPTAFHEQVDRWSLDRGMLRPLDPVFTCLLLRVLACSLHYINPKLITKLQMEMGQSVEDLAANYHHAAQELSQTIRPGQGGLNHVQELLFATFWLKSTAKYVASWHALSAAVREAQEQGIHRNSSMPKDMTMFDVDLRRRIWCIIYVWDWQTSTLLDRPRLINRKDCSTELPNTDRDSESIHAPSPIMPTVLQFQLIERLSEKFDSVHDTKNIISYRGEIIRWMSTFPPALRITGQVEQIPEDDPYVHVQRAQLHATSYAMMLHPLKPFLSRPMDPSVMLTEQATRRMAVDCILSLTEALRAYFNVVVDLYNKTHFLSCSVFDTAVTLCCAVVHDKESRNLPHRDQVLVAIRILLDILREVKHSTGTASVPYSILKRMIAVLPLSEPERDKIGVKPRNSNGNRNDAASSAGPNDGARERPASQNAASAAFPEDGIWSEERLDSTADQFLSGNAPERPDDIFDWDVIDPGLTPMIIEPGAMENRGE